MASSQNVKVYHIFSFMKPYDLDKQSKIIRGEQESITENSIFSLHPPHTVLQVWIWVDLLLEQYQQARWYFNIPF